METKTLSFNELFHFEEEVELKLEEFKTLISLAIEDYIHDNKISLEDFAREAGLTYYDVFYIIRGQVDDIPLSMLAKISTTIKKDLISYHS
jgi:DNA-binding Xre family transcriptional regulator